MNPVQRQIEAHLLSVTSILHPEGEGIAKFVTANVTPRRIFNLYPLELRELPRQMASLLNSPEAVLKFCGQMLDEAYAEVLDELCEAVPDEQRGPLLVPVVSVAKDARHIDAILEHSAEHFGERWEAKAPEVVRAAITSAGETMWLAANHLLIDELKSGAEDILWLVEKLNDCLQPSI